MNSIEAHEILANNISTLKEISKDNHDGIEYYMTESTLTAVDFDAVKDEYVKKQKLGHEGHNPKSIDAIFFDSKGKQVFIEFKNGYIDKKEQYMIIQKIYDSLLIYSDIICENIKYTREQIDCILVYNELKNNEKNKDKISKNNVQNAESRDHIGKRLSRLAGTSFRKYGLEIFKNYCFREVYTCTEAEFEEFLNSFSE